jgi:1-acyl-sn-glycerol-3-phosphate acyltransferase
VIRANREQLSALEGFERVAFAITDGVNRVGPLKWVADTYLRYFVATWITAATKNLLHVHGLENATSLAPDRGVVIASNHTSFFDMYVISARLFKTAPWFRSLYFPVRSDYFYDRPDGVLVNAFMAALCMYPPVLRSQRKKAFNQYTVQYLTEVARRPGVAVGIHPEGTRNKSGDAYTLLPSQPGIGQIVHGAHPIVLPMFIQGLGNDLPRQIRGNFDGTGEPITLVVGPPMNLERFYGHPAGVKTYKRIADAIRDEITALGETERELRVRLSLPAKGPARPRRTPQAA